MDTDGFLGISGVNSGVDTARSRSSLTWEGMEGPNPPLVERTWVYIGFHEMGGEAEDVRLWGRRGTRMFGRRRMADFRAPIIMEARGWYGRVR